MKKFKDIREELNESRKLHALIAGAMLALGTHHAHAQDALQNLSQHVKSEEQAGLPSHKIAHETKQEAALAGMHQCKTKMDPNLECGFGVYQHENGKFYHTKVQSGKNGSIDGMAINMPKTAKLVAFGHTHPSEPHARENDTTNWFSKEDIKFAHKTGLHMYMGSQKSGKVVEYVKGKTKINHHSTMGAMSFGDEVGDYS